MRARKVEKRMQARTTEERDRSWKLLQWCEVWEDRQTQTHTSEFSLARRQVRSLLHRHTPCDFLTSPPASWLSHLVSMERSLILIIYLLPLFPICPQRSIHFSTCFNMLRKIPTKKTLSWWARREVCWEHKFWFWYVYFLTSFKLSAIILSWSGDSLERNPAGQQHEQPDRLLSKIIIEMKPVIRRSSIFSQNIFQFTHYQLPNICMHASYSLQNMHFFPRLRFLICILTRKLGNKPSHSTLSYILYS